MPNDNKNKAAALKTIVSCAAQYKENFLNKVLLFLYIDKNMEVKAQELNFEAGNFLHLTGCDTDIYAKDFFKRCIKGRISEDDFDFRTDGATRQKLHVLPLLMEKDLSARQIGVYNNFGISLECDKVLGDKKTAAAVAVFLLRRACFGIIIKLL